MPIKSETVLYIPAYMQTLPLTEQSVFAAIVTGTHADDIIDLTAFPVSGNVIRRRSIAHGTLSEFANTWITREELADFLVLPPAASPADELDGPVF